MHIEIILKFGSHFVNGNDVDMSYLCSSIINTVGVRSIKIVHKYQGIFRYVFPWELFTHSNNKHTNICPMTVSGTLHTLQYTHL